MDLKGGQTYTVNSGWKVWKKIGSTSPQAEGDGEPF